MVHLPYILLLRIAFEIASFHIYTPLPAFLEVFEAVLKITFWNVAELFCHGRKKGLNVSMEMAF
jgi:hypothetical protein